MQLLDFVILALAAWRISNMIHYERGPVAIFRRFRQIFGVSHDESDEPTTYPSTEMGELLSCLDCGSIYIGVGLVGLYLAAGSVACYVALPFAISAGAIIIGKYINRG